MAYLARTVTPADGATDLFPVSFPLSPIQGREGVGVYVHAATSADPGNPLTEGVDYSWISDGQISFLAGHRPAAGTVVDVRRETDIQAIDNLLQSGGSLRSSELVQNDQQLLYLLQERSDENQDLKNLVAGLLRDAPTVSGIVLDTSKYVRLDEQAGVWPYGDLVYHRIQHGTPTSPIVTDAGAGGDFFAPERVEAYIAPGHRGGVELVMPILQIRGAPDPASTNLNYTPLQTDASSTVNVGGTGTTLGTAKGALFGAAFLATLYPGATDFLNLTGAEFNVQAQETVLIKTGNQIVQMSDDTHSGSLVDAGLAFSNQLGAVNWNMVVCLSHPYNGQHSVKPTGTLLGTIGNPTCLNGLDLTGVTFTGSSIKVPGFSVDGAGRTKLTVRGNFANDGAAATGGVDVSELYRNGSVIQIRVA